MTTSRVSQRLVWLPLEGRGVPHGLKSKKVDRDWPLYGRMWGRKKALGIEGGTGGYAHRGRSGKGFHRENQGMMRRIKEAGRR